MVDALYPEAKTFIEQVKEYAGFLVAHQESALDNKCFQIIGAAIKIYSLFCEF